MHTGSAGLTILFYSVMESGPDIVSENEAYCFVLTRMSRQYVIMPVPEYTEAEVRRVRNIYKGFVAEETVGGGRPVRFRIRGKGLEDFTMELFLVHDYCCMENGIC